MKLNYQAYANSANARHNRRAAVIITWANKTIYLYHFTAHKKNVFIHIAASRHIYLFLVTPRLTLTSCETGGKIDTRRRKVETRDSHGEQTHAELAST